MRVPTFKDGVARKKLPSHVFSSRAISGDENGPATFSWVVFKTACPYSWAENKGAGIKFTPFSRTDGAGPKPQFPLIPMFHLRSKSCVAPTSTEI